MEWSEDDEKLIAKLWAEGLSASVIAERMPGRTRNAIIGKAHRLQLTPRRRTPSGFGEGKMPPRKKPQPRVFVFRRPKLPPQPRKERIVSTPVPEPVSLRLSLMEIQDHQCRFIADDPRAGATFCGHPTVGKFSWCAHHLAVVSAESNAKSAVPFRKPIVSARTGIAA